MEKEKNTQNDTLTMEYNNVTKSAIINQTLTDIDYDSNIEYEAYVLFKKAKSKLQRRCCLYFLISSKNERIEKSCELFKKSGDKYKMCNQWKKAGICYKNGALLKEKLNQDPLFFYKQSYYCFSKIDIGNDSKKIFDKMNNYLEKEGHYFEAGKNNENLAIQKENKKKYEEAINYYIKAINNYEKDGKHESLKIKMQKRLAELMQLYDHPEAQKKVPIMLENIGTNYLKNPISRYASKDYFGKAILSILYYRDNPEEVNEKISKYKKLDKSFYESPIYNLCKEIINSMENNDHNKLKTSIEQYKEANELDDFMVDILDKLVEKSKKLNNLTDSASIEDTNNHLS